jgi:predicted TIM-barrel fold metal-dependent hydrolase
MMRLAFFDVNCAIGRTRLPSPRVLATARDLLDEMRFHGIRAALVSHAVARESSPRMGNALLSEETAPHPELLACWTVLPPSTGEMPGPDALTQEMRARGVRAVRMYPDVHGYRFTHDSCGDLLAVLERERAPLLLTMQRENLQRSDWDEIADACTRHPALPIVLTRVSWRIDRLLFPLLERLPNLFVETSFYQGHRAIEEYCRRFGATRLLFGTHLPVCAPGASLMPITHADLPDEQKAAIAGGNLRRLLGLPAIPGDRDDGACDGNASRREILALLGKRDPLGEPLIIDAHGHIGPDGGAHVAEDSADGLVKSMDLAGINRMVISSIVGLLSDYRLGNTMIGEAIQRHPSRLSGYAVVNPLCMNDREIEEELFRCFDELGMSGIKLHQGYHPYPPDGERLRPALEFARRRKAPILIHAHSTDENLGKWQGVCGSCPEVPFLFAHAGADFRAADRYIALSRNAPNAYLEVTYSSVPFGMIEYLVEGAGADKVLYGSDATFRDPRPQLGWVIHARISHGDKLKVLGLTMDGILRRIERTGAAAGASSH